MEPKEYDFEFPRGDTCPVSFTLTVGGETIDLTDAEITLTARVSKAQNALIVFQKKKSNGDITVSNGKVSFIFQHEDTSGLKKNQTIYYDVELKSGDYYKTLLTGYIKVGEEETY